MSKICLAFFPLVVCILGFCMGSAHALEPNQVILSMENEPVTLDWHAAQSHSERFILSFLMRGLLKYDGRYQPACDLCTQFSVSPDRKIYTFDLRTAIRWTDGVLLEAKHFVDSFKRLTDPKKKFRASEPFRIISQVRAPTHSRLEITLSQPQSFFAHLLTTIPSFPIRKELIESGPSGLKHASSAVLGPHMLAEWAQGKWIVLEGNPTYVSDRPAYRVMFLVGSHPKQLELFRRGKIDILAEPKTEDMVRLDPSKSKLQVNPYIATRSLLFNSKEGPLMQLHLRRAILYALDREVFPAIVKGGERRATGMVPPRLAGYRDLPLVTADVARAQAERSQVPPTSTPIPLVLLSTQNDADQKAAFWLSKQLEPYQIATQLRALPDAGYFTALEKGDFDMAIYTWTLSAATPMDLLQNFHSQSKRNWGRWNNMTFDALLEKIAQSGETLPPAAILDQMLEILEREAVGAIPLGYPTLPFLLGRRVGNFTTTPFGFPDLLKIQIK